MKTVIHFLNAILDPGIPPKVEKPDALAALNAIEEHPLLVGALRNLLLFPKNDEAVSHATRLLKEVDSAAARLAALAAPKEEQFADLV